MDAGFLFPGQGSQAKGMGTQLYQNSPEAKSVFDSADKLLGRSLTTLCFEGPEEELTKTLNAQLAIFVTSLAALAALRKAQPSIKPKLSCGLSLGEFTALVALNALSFEEGLKLVETRAQLMERSCQSRPGTMASVMGLEQAKVEELCRQSGAELANINSPDQLVISGTVNTINTAVKLAETMGAKRAIVLKVGGAFHSSLMKDAEAGLTEALRKTTIRKPEGVFIPNVYGTPVSDPEEIRTLLARQLTSPVQWIKSMQTVAQTKIQPLLEIGHGKVLKGLARRIDSSLQVTNIETTADLESFSKITTTA